jgi:Transposase DNA-binding
MSEAARGVSGSGSSVNAAGGASWIDAELAGCVLGDKRLCNRLRRLLQQLEGAMGAPLPLACQDGLAVLLNMDK